jgi:nicotinate-nucleotide pyrophosphorylase (carboxylating)
MSAPRELELPGLAELVQAALAEDLGAAGDITSSLIVGPDQPGKANIVARSAGILAGVRVVEEVFRQVDEKLLIDWVAGDGGRILPGTVVATLSGRARAILAGERVALNFLQHLSGVATATAELAKICRRYGVQLLCTRKTLPGLRVAQRYAVAVGGGALHRAGLYDAVLIKTNHIKLVGGISAAVSRARTYSEKKVEVEVTSVEELEEAVDAGAHSVLLDNAELKTIELAVSSASGRARLEISGGVSLGNIAEIARLRPDAISVGRITHSVRALDMALHFLDS